MIGVTIFLHLSKDRIGSVRRSFQRHWMRLYILLIFSNLSFNAEDAINTVCQAYIGSQIALRSPADI
jgi:hypothetical protein